MPSIVVIVKFVGKVISFFNRSAKTLGVWFAKQSLLKKFFSISTFLFISYSWRIETVAQTVDLDGTLQVEQYFGAPGKILGTAPFFSRRWKSCPDSNFSFFLLWCWFVSTQLDSKSTSLKKLSKFLNWQLVSSLFEDLL